MIASAFGVLYVGLILLTVELTSRSKLLSLVCFGLSLVVGVYALNEVILLINAGAE